MNHLLPCPECSRHVRVSEAECPFCKAPLELSGAPEPLLPRARLSRAATFAFSATLASASALAACGADYSDEGKGGAGSGGAATAGSAGAATAGAATAGASGTGFAAVYGAPAAAGVPPVGPDNSAGNAPIPVYGAAP